MSAQTIGPPKSWVRNGDVNWKAISDRGHVNFALSGHGSGSQIVDHNRRIRIYAGDDLDLGGHVGNAGTNLPSHQMQIGDARVVPGFDENRTPDAAGDKTWAPIPTILVGRFASVRTGFLSLIVSRGKFVVHLCHDGQDFIYRRTKVYPQSVRAEFRQAFYVHPPGAKHIVRADQ